MSDHGRAGDNREQHRRNVARQALWDQRRDAVVKVLTDLGFSNVQATYLPNNPDGEFIVVMDT